MEVIALRVEWDEEKDLIGVCLQIFEAWHVQIISPSEGSSLVRLQSTFTE